MEYLTISLILFTLGVIMLLAEVLLPTGGVLVVLALLFFALGVGIILSEGTTTEAVVALTALAVGLPAAGYVAVAAYRRMSIGAELDDPASGGSLPIAGQAELEALKNRTGRTVSPMRPAGTVEFDGKRIDAMTEGVMLDAGVWVRCVAVKGNIVLVRQMDPPADMSDIVPPDAKKPDDVPNIHLDVSPLPPPATGLPSSPARQDSPASPPPPPRPADDLDDLDLDLGR